MPAINTTPPHLSTEVVLNHFFDSGLYVLETNFGLARFVGFICTQGAAYLEQAKLGKVKAKAITNGDGGEGCEWQLLKEGQALYAMIILSGGNPQEECYIIVNDEGWPILADPTSPTTVPPETEYRRNFHSYFSDKPYVSKNG